MTQVGSPEVVKVVAECTLEEPIEPQTERGGTGVLGGLEEVFEPARMERVSPEHCLTWDTDVLLEVGEWGPIPLVVLTGRHQSQHWRGSMWNPRTY